MPCQTEVAGKLIVIPDSERTECEVWS